MKVGQIVKIADKWRSPIESPLDRYIVVEDNGDRCVISPYPCSLPLVPRQTVINSMVEPVEG